MPDAESKKPNRPGDFISKVVTDPANPPELMRLSGYRGASSEAGHTRLYANPELSVYWDIPEADVLHEQAVPPDTDPLGSVTLWVKRDSKIVPHAGKKGAEENMYTYTGAAAPQAGLNTVHLTPTTIHPTPLCPTPQCTYSPILVFCTLNTRQPYCWQAVSADCPPQTPIHTVTPTITQTTIHTGTGTIFGGGAQQQAQAFAAAPQGQQFMGPAAGPQMGGIQSVLVACLPHSFIPQLCPPSPPPLLCISPIPVHCTISPIPIHCTHPPSPPLAICTHPPSIVVHCTPPPSPPFAICTVQTIQQTQIPQLCTIAVSPNCPTPGTFPTTFPTTPQTTVQTGQQGFAPQAFGQAQAQPFAQAAPQQQQVFHGTATINSVYIACIPFTHQAHCFTPFTPVSPFCTPPSFPSITVSFPTSIVAGGGGF
jgi:hypothetical protein